MNKLNLKVGDRIRVGKWEETSTGSWFLSAEEGIVEEQTRLGGDFRKHTFLVVRIRPEQYLIIEKIDP